MPFIPHTEQDIQAMLKVIGIKKTEQLFDEIPADLKIDGFKNIAKGMSEMEIAQHMRKLAAKDKTGLCFIGAGAYEHHIPAPVWEIAGRGEFMTAYTPYQAEASQGTLQVIYEYQTMMANLMGMDASNASLYDGASAVAEAALMAIRANRKSKSKTILMPKTLHPTYQKAAHTIASPQGTNFVAVDYAKAQGKVSLEALTEFEGHDISAVIIPCPNFFGILENVDALTDWAHEQGALVIAVVNPLAMALLQEPSAWGKIGADIVVGDGQPLGSPLSCGGPYFGFMCCRKDYLRSMPGRIIGKTTDDQGRVGYVLNLQAREQHIRRSKATSNICTNQGLMVTAATIYMSLLGAEGMHNVAAKCHENAYKLREILSKVPGVKLAFQGEMFHEFVLQLARPATEVLAELAEKGVQGGYNLTHEYPELGEAILVCATETKSKEDLQMYADTLTQVGGEA